MEQNIGAQDNPDTESTKTDAVDSGIELSPEILNPQAKSPADGTTTLKENEDSTVESSSKDDEEQAPCVHHWIIERPKDFKEEATCKKCDAIRVFSEDKAITPFARKAVVIDGETHKRIRKK